MDKKRKPEEKDINKNKNKKNKNSVIEKPEGILTCPLCNNTSLSLEEEEDQLKQINNNENNSGSRKIVKEYIYLHRKYYYSCEECTLVFVPPNFHSSNEKEKERYEHHNNSPNDEKYKDFLRPTIKLLIPYLESLKDTIKSKEDDKDKELLGLDYGCGPSPTLSLMFKESGYTLDDYDPYFKSNIKVETLSKEFYNNPNNNNNNNEKVEENSYKSYDFLTCTEAIEHFKSPLDELNKIFNSKLLREKDGIVLIMTQLLKNDDMFKTWFYPRDHTHICFFRKSTFEWISKKFNRECKVFEDENIIIFK